MVENLRLYKNFMCEQKVIMKGKTLKHFLECYILNRPQVML